jgi:hypothetical protein
MSDPTQNGKLGSADSDLDEPGEARPLAGAWADLDWEEALDELDRIRHESDPTPPIDLL